MWTDAGQSAEVACNEEDDEQHESAREQRVQLRLAAEVLADDTSRQRHAHHVAVEVSTHHVRGSLRQQLLVRVDLVVVLLREQLRHRHRNGEGDDRDGDCVTNHLRHDVRLRERRRRQPVDITCF